MFNKSVLHFLSQLKKNNTREWMDAHRKEYEKAKSDFYAFTDSMIAEIAKFDAEIGFLKAKDCAFRINRDIRFSKDKSPYKTNMGAYVNRNGKKGGGAGYYFHAEPGNVFMAAGVWMPEPTDLAKIRQEIDYNFPEFKKIISTTAFKKEFPDGIDREDTLMRAPKGYEENNPAIDFLKLKSFIIRKSFSDKDILQPEFLKTICNAYRTARPLMTFIDTALD